MATYKTYLHKRGPGACGRPAFLYEADYIGMGLTVESKHALALDGQPVIANTPMVCGTCGKFVREGMTLMRANFADDDHTIAPSL
jgi:hypothetical protein